MVVFFLSHTHTLTQTLTHTNTNWWQKYCHWCRQDNHPVNYIPNSQVQICLERWLRVCLITNLIALLVIPCAWPRLLVYTYCMLNWLDKKMINEHCFQQSLKLGGIPICDLSAKKLPAPFNKKKYVLFKNLVKLPT